MRHRDLLDLHEFKSEEARIEAAQKAHRKRHEDAERLFKAEAIEEQRREKQRAFMVDCIQNSTDPQLFVSPEMVTASMPSAEADKFNKAEAARFARENPEWTADYSSAANFAALGSYFERNGVRIADAETVKAAFRRLVSLGIITKRVKPTPEPEYDPDPVRHARPVNMAIEKPKPQHGDKVTGGTLGRDWATGRDRVFTDREVNRMSSLEFKRAFPTASTVAELLTTMTANRG